MASDFALTVLGTRGSMAIGGPLFREFGGGTSCYMVRAGAETIFLDAGSGLVSAPDHYEKPPVILLSHLHLDHVMGLGMFPLLSQRGKKATLYVPFCKDTQDACRQIDRVFSPPIWPLNLDKLEAELSVLPLPERFEIGAVRVETMPGSHPGGAVVYKLSCGDRSLVYATDYEHSAESDKALADFSRNADLLLYDAQFAADEYMRKRGFGHSTAEKGLEIMERAGVRRLLLIHHDPHSTDQVLLEREAKLPTERASYAREGEVISL